MDSDKKAKLIKFFLATLAVFFIIVILQSKVADDKKSLHQDRVQVVDTRSSEKSYDQSAVEVIRTPTQVIVGQSFSGERNTGSSSSTSLNSDQKSQSERPHSSPSNHQVLGASDNPPPAQNNGATVSTASQASGKLLINDTVVSLPNSTVPGATGGRDGAPSPKLNSSSAKINDTVVPRSEGMRQAENISVGSKMIPSSQTSRTEVALQWKRQPGVNLGQVDFNPSHAYRWPQVIAFFILFIIATKTSFHLLKIRRGRVLHNTLSFQVINIMNEFTKLLNFNTTKIK